MERFDLAPWELAPDSPESLEGVATARIRAEWLGEEREFLLRKALVWPEQPLVFAREVGFVGEGNWVLCPQLSLMGQIDLNSLLCVEEMFVRTTRDWKLARVFHLPLRVGGEQKWIQVASQANTGQVVCAGEPIYNATPFRFRFQSGLAWPEFVSKQSPVQEKQRILGELNDPFSDINFALLWEQLSEAEQFSFVVRCQRDSPKQLYSLLECAWKCSSHKECWAFTIPMGSPRLWQAKLFFLKGGDMHSSHGSSRCGTKSWHQPTCVSKIGWTFPSIN